MRRLAGLYFVVDGRTPESKLLLTVRAALEGGVDLVQLWGTWKTREKALRAATKLKDLCHAHDALMIVVDDAELARTSGADGVHLDGYEIPSETPRKLKERFGAEFIVGVTCGNNMGKVRWAEENDADYISFCSIFPTSSVDTCDIVPVERIREAKQAVSLPVFASGGITLENVDQVLDAGADGIALVSALAKAEDPKRAAELFKERIKKFVVNSRISGC